ncbi:MAG: universal stress protein [Lacunisphaera sp.]
MKKFLVPVDFSAVSEDVFDSAIALLRALGGQATLLYVIPAAAAAPDLPVPAPALRKARSAALALARKKLAAKLRAFHPARPRLQGPARIRFTRRHDSAGGPANPGRLHHHGLPWPRQNARHARRQHHPRRPAESRLQCADPAAGRSRV